VKILLVKTSLDLTQYLNTIPIMMFKDALFPINMIITVMIMVTISPLELSHNPAEVQDRNGAKILVMT